LEEANAISDDLHFTITSLAEHVAHGRTDGIPHWHGELRSGARANLLMGVASNRVDVHQAEMRSVQALERRAEPLAALHLPAEQWPAAFLAQAWQLVIRNSAHDSICACSVDEVGRAVIHRFDEVLDLADGLTRRSLAALARTVGSADPLVVNPSATTRSGTVELALPGTDPVPGTQLLLARPERAVIGETIAVDAVPYVLRKLEEDPFVHRAEVGEADGLVTVTLFADAATPRPALTGPIVEQLRQLLGSGSDDAPVVVAKVRPAEQVVVARVADVPGFGWKVGTAIDTDAHPVTVDDGGLTLTNGLVTVAVDAADGTFSIDGHGGLGRLVDDGDSGDTYNYNPPAGDVVVDRPDAVRVAVGEPGPVRAKVRIETDLTLPERVVDDARVGSATTTVVTTLELHAGERMVRVTVEVDNRVADHRLRAWFPLPDRADSSLAECAFTVVRRGLTAEGGMGEHPLPTFPSRRFVQAGGLTVAHEGLLEYELVDVEGGTAGALALTLLRCTGLISEGPMDHRLIPAGPRIATPDAQMPGRQVLRYAVALGDSDPYAMADDAFLPLLVARPGGSATDHTAGSALSVHGAQVSSVRRNQGRLEVRVFNPTDQPTTVTVEGRRGHLVDLAGRVVDTFEGSFELGPHRIATAALKE
jgi:hypothetical protein